MVIWVLALDWAGANVGYGYINNVTFHNFWFANVDQITNLDTCYFNINASQCAQFPSRVNMINVTFENFSGSTSSKAGRVLATLRCSTSPDAVCENITFRNITATSPCGTPGIVVCDGLKGGVGGEMPCYPSNAPDVKSAQSATCTVPQATITALPWTK